MSVADWAQAIALGVERQDGDVLARLFSLHTKSTRRALATIADPSERVVKAVLTRVALPSPWSDMTVSYVRCGALLFGHASKRKEPAEAWHQAFEALQAAASVFLRHFLVLAPGRWALPLLRALMLDVRWIAKRADEAANAAAPPGTRRAQAHLEACARTLNRGFSACVADRHPVLHESKKWGTYAMVNLVFGTYFALKSISLCKNIVRALDAGDLPPLSAYAAVDVVPFLYYQGRLAFMDEEYTKADEALTLALMQTPHTAPTLRERILLYLIPVRLLHGQRPSAQLLAPFPRLEALYAHVLEACRRGDVRTLDQTLSDAAYERPFVRLGVFLALERVRAVCITRLLRRVWRHEGGGTRLRLAPMAQALQWIGAADDALGAEWLIATQIAQGRIKGYVAHERQMLVLSANDPFPCASLTMLRTL